MKLTLLAIIIILAVAIPLHSAWGWYTTYETNFYGTRMQDADTINANWHLDQQPEVLYLEPGDAPYFIHANSSSRYISPLPVERNRDGWNITYLPEYQEDYNDIWNYNGTFLIEELGGNTGLDWWGDNQQSNKELREHIYSRYHLIFNQSWRIYEHDK
jgi:hypothetical protein